MPTFDIVSRIDVGELDNALNGIGREVKQRYDLKGTMCSIERSGDNITIIADDQMRLRQMHELVHKYCVRRGLDSSSLEFRTPQNASKGSLRQDVLIRQGVDEATGKQVMKAVKGSKLKVQVSIQGNEIRVTGKKRDDLQETINLLKEMKVDLPLQYVNYRD